MRFSALIRLAIALAALSPLSLQAQQEGWRARPLTPGGWTYRAEAAGSSTQFGTGSGTRVVLRCLLPAQTMTLWVAGGSAGTMTVRSTAGIINWPVQSADRGATATLGARDPGLDRMIGSRGRFSIEAPGAEPLTLPVWAEVARVIEDCRG